MMRLYRYLALITLASLTGPSWAWEATIERDYLGVPHIHGKTDADAAFGLAYAQAEDAWPIMEDGIPFIEGRPLSIRGEMQQSPITWSMAGPLGHSGARLRAS